MATRKNGLPLTDHLEDAIYLAGRAAGELEKETFVDHIAEVTVMVQLAAANALIALVKHLEEKTE